MYCTYGAAINPASFGGVRGLIEGSSSRSDNSFHISNAWDAIVKISFVYFWKIDTKAKDGGNLWWLTALVQTYKRPCASYVGGLVETGMS